MGESYMKELGKLICHIPARNGSKRVPLKNMRYIGDKPLIAYAIECAMGVGIFDDIYVNTDSEKLCQLAKACGVKSYRRSDWLASDEAKGDDFTADFMENVQSDTLLMINPVCPLISPEDVLAAISAYRESDCDTLISCEQTQMQVFYDGKGVNINADAALEPTQNNPSVMILNWAITIWDTEIFIRTYHKSKKGYLGTKRLFFPIDPIKAIKISHEEDFQIAEQLIQLRKMLIKENLTPRYWTSDD
jgi:CMP-N,N'-diacetyllegionaminic acid synthase